MTPKDIANIHFKICTSAFPRLFSTFENLNQPVIITIGKLAVIGRNINCRVGYMSNYMFMDRSFVHGQGRRVISMLKLLHQKEYMSILLHSLKSDTTFESQVSSRCRDWDNKEPPELKGDPGETKVPGLTCVHACIYVCVAGGTKGGTSISKKVFSGSRALKEWLLDLASGDCSGWTVFVK